MDTFKNGFFGIQEWKLPFMVTFTVGEYVAFRAEMVGLAVPVKDLVILPEFSLKFEQYYTINKQSEK